MVHFKKRMYVYTYVCAILVLCYPQSSLTPKLALI